MSVISESVKFPAQVTLGSILFSFSLREEAAAGKVKVAWRDIGLKWLEGKPQAFIQITHFYFFFFSFNFGSIKLDVEPSAVRHLIKYLSGCWSCEACLE